MEMVEVKNPLRNPTYQSDSKMKTKDEFAMAEGKAECRRRLVSKFKICWALISFLVSVVDVTVILYLSYLHFSHSSDLIAWLMLLPILLNFIGIFTFLSNKTERRAMQALGGNLSKNFMFFPVIGPSFAALRLFFYAFEEDAEKFERLESLLLRMKQYEAYFRAAPEAFIQITFRIISWSQLVHYHAEDYWTSACIALCVYALAESHLYGGLLKYYRMFHYEPGDNAWRTDHFPFKWKAAMFFFTYFSINSRLIADAVQKSVWCFYFGDTYSFGEIIIINFLVQFVLRAGFYFIYNSWLGSQELKIQLVDEGVYGAFTYSWRCLFLSLDFQSYQKTIFCWFFLENFIMLLTPYGFIYGTPWFGGKAQNVLEGRTVYHVYVGLGVLMSILALGVKVGVRYHYKRRQNRVNASA